MEAFINYLKSKEMSQNTIRLVFLRCIAVLITLHNGKRRIPLVS